jgi:hypothetical protein
LRLLAFAGALALAGLVPAAGRAESVVSRITYYTESGIMADGVYTFDGAAACGDAIQLGSTIHIIAPDVWLVCHDRGYLAPYQIDVFSPGGRPAWMDLDYFDIEVW